MSEITPKEFFEGEWYKDATKKLCADGWPMFVVPLNIQVRNLLEENQKLQRRIDVFERAKRIWDRRSSGEYSDLNDASQEAAHYCWLDEQNEKLEDAVQVAVDCLEKARSLVHQDNVFGTGVEWTSFRHWSVEADKALSELKSLGIVKEGEK